MPKSDKGAKSASVKSGSDAGSDNEEDKQEAPLVEDGKKGGLLSRFTARFARQPLEPPEPSEVDFLEEDPELYVDRDGADSDTNAEAATLFPRRPLVRSHLLSTSLARRG